MAGTRKKEVKEGAEPEKQGGIGHFIKPMAIASVVAGTAWLARRVSEMMDPYDGMDDIVSYSSRMIAGARAIETEEGDAAIIIDPLAAKLAGKKALKAARRRREPAQPSNDTGRKNKIGRIAVRTKWFDDQLEASLGMPSSTGMNHVVQTVGDRMPMQVVELGAGLSTRPWRLHLPATVHWFDVDRQDVLDAKEIMLEKYGAEVDLMSPVRRSMSKNSMLESKIGSIDHHFEGVQYPLRCASRVGVAADLGHKGWTKGLMAAGFDPIRPTVWIAEGLLMYLEEEHVSALLEETRSLSAPGSAFLTVSVPEQVIKEIKDPSSKKNKGLMKEWVFGCPEDPTEWMKSHGWHVKQTVTRSELASLLNYDQAVCTFEIGKSSNASRAIFIAASSNP